MYFFTFLFSNQKKETAFRVWCGLSLMEHCWESQMRSRVTPCRTLLTINLPASSAAQTTLRLSVTLPKNPLYVSRDLKYSPVSDNMMKLKMALTSSWNISFHSIFFQFDQHFFCCFFFFITFLLWIPCVIGDRNLLDNQTC